MRRLLWTAAFVLGACAPGLAQTGPADEGHAAFRDKRYEEAAEHFEDAEEHYWQGRAHFAAKQYEEARAALQVAFTDRPGDPMVTLYLGRACLELEDYAASIKALEQAFRRKRKDKRVLYWLGTAYRRAGKPGKAVGPLTELARLDPSDARPRADLGSALLEAGQPSSAARAFQEACDRAPRVARHYTWLGIAHFRAKAYPAARAALVESLRRGDKDPTAHYWLGRTFLEQGDPKRAARAFGEAAKRDRRSATPRLWEARAHVAAKDSAAAIEALRGVAAKSTDATLLAYYGRLLASERRHDEAATALRKASGLTPKDVSLLRDLAEAHIALRQDPTAATVLEQAVKTDPSDLASWRRLGGLYAKAGKVVPARNAYRHLVVDVERPTHEDLALCGRAELAAGNPKDAVMLIERSLALRPADLKPDPSLRGDLGVAHYLNGNPEAGVEALRAATAILNKDVRYLDYLGRSLHRSGQKVPAAGVFKRAIAVDEKKTRAQPHRHLALYALEADRIEQARKLAEQAVAIDRRDPSCRETAGRAAVAAEAYGPAFAHFLVALKVAPKRVSVALLAGKAGVLAGQAAEAEPILRRCLKGSEADLAHLWLGRALSALERFDEATEHLGQAARAMPKSVTVWVSLSEAQVGAELPAKAVDSLRRALALTPADGDLHRRLHEALVAAERFDTADDARREWAGAVYPDLVDASRPGRDRAQEAEGAAGVKGVAAPLVAELHLLRGGLLSELGELKAAGEALALAERLAPWSYRNALLGGSLAERQGDHEPAVARYREAAKRAPGRAEPRVAIARVLLGEGLVARTLAELRAAVEAHPKASAPALELLRILSLRGETAKAIELLRGSAQALDEDAKGELRSSPDFAALWSAGVFRELVGEPVPGGWGRPLGERALSGPKGAAYFEGGELVE
jgi:tetratricopeptide (TPR) repeat protein